MADDTVRKRRQGAKRWLAAGAAAAALAVIALVAVQEGRRWLAQSDSVQHVDAAAGQIELGRYLATVADCAACHTAHGGAPLAGGRPLQTPFGAIHSTNITPDPDHGIGRYTAEEFHRALTRGTARDGHLLYPAMPYTSYRGISRQDSDAMYAYLMNVPAVAQPNRENGLSFPFNLRFGLYFWNFLFAGDGQAQARQDDAPALLRGKYLVDTLGHCAQCHSPRGALGQTDRRRPLAGNNTLARFAAPDITRAGLLARGWTEDELRRYLRTGVSAVAVASGEMLEAVNLSTSRWRESDIDAAVSYLFASGPQAAPPAVAQAEAGRPMEQDLPGRSHYLNLCAGCHAANGRGVPHVAPGLLGNSSVTDADPHNLLVSILDGLPAHELPGLERMQAMPGFARTLSDEDISALGNWLRVEYGKRPASVTPGDVARLRQR